MSRLTQNKHLKLFTPLLCRLYIWESEKNNHKSINSYFYASIKLYFIPTIKQPRFNFAFNILQPLLRLIMELVTDIMKAIEVTLIHSGVNNESETMEFKVS